MLIIGTAGIYSLASYAVAEGAVVGQLFAKLKHRLRKAAQRTAQTVGDAIADILQAVTSKECSNYIANAGYE